MAYLDYSELNHILQTYLDQFVLDQKQGGGSICVFHQGKLVTKLASGIANMDKSTGETSLWTTTTLSLNFSTGKGVLVTLIHVLVSLGLLDYDTPISHYWSAFGQNGKENITLQNVLSHEAGLFEIIQVTEHAKDMLDWQAMVSKIESMPITQKKTFTTNERFVAYSALVSGWVLGSLIEKVTGLALQTALDKYLAEPLGIQGQVYFGVPPDKIEHVANPIRDTTNSPNENANSSNKKEERAKPTFIEDSNETLEFYQNLPLYELWQQRLKQEKLLTTQQINSLYFDPSQIDMADYKAALVPAGSRQFNYYHPSSLQAKIPAANGVTSCIALATIYAMLANGGTWQGKTIITPAVFERLSSLQNNQQDKVMPANMQWRLGYHRVFSLNKNSKKAFGHMGYNGSMAWCDPSCELALAFVHNYDVTMLNEIRQFIVNETVFNFFDKG